MLINNKYYFVGHIYSDILKNEIGNTMLTRSPFINFSVIYTHNIINTNTGFSLRSDDTRTNVSTIATYFNGGGHRNAAGCGATSIINHLPCRVIDINNLYTMLKNIYIKIINKSIFVLLNTQLCNKHIVKYLMQYRVNEQQECSYILNKNIKFDGAIAYYNINEDEITGYICLNNNILIDKKKELINIFNIKNDHSFRCNKKKIDN